MEKQVLLQNEIVKLESTIKEQQESLEFNVNTIKKLHLEIELLRGKIQQGAQVEDETMEVLEGLKERGILREESGDFKLGI